MRNARQQHLIVEVNPEWRIGIVHSTYYKEEVGAMVEAALETLVQAGVKEEGITVHPAPGSFEIPLLGAALAAKGKVDALMGLGIIVQGETKHADLLASEVARGIMEVQVRFQIPFAFEVLYVESMQQVLERCRGKGNKGREAALAVLHSLAELKWICS